MKTQKRLGWRVFDLVLVILVVVSVLCVSHAPTLLCDGFFSVHAFIRPMTTRLFCPIRAEISRKSFCTLSRVK